MGDFLLTAIIITVFVLGMLFFIGLCLSLPGIIRGILGTDSHSVQRHVRQALEGAKIRVAKKGPEDSEEPDGFDSSDYKDYLRWRRANRQRLYRELDEELNAAVAERAEHRPPSRLKRSEARISKRGK